MEAVPIRLTSGFVAFVDPEDVEQVISYRWSYSGGYAVSHRVGSMHRFLVNPPHDMQVDHVNGDRLDNRRSNLRIATCTQNQWNRGKTCLAKARSRFKGVQYHNFSGLWRARIRVNGRRLSLGYYRTEEAAAHAYSVAARMLHGEFAKL